IFPTKKYDDGYLKTLEHLHICAGASDRLRYAILNKFGGVYLDTDLMTNFNLENLTNNQSINNLIDSVQWNNIYNGQDLSNQKFELIINQMITLDCLNQLNNDKKIKNFSKHWEHIFSGNFEKNQKIFQEIAKEFKSLNLKLEPEIKLSNFPINNSLQSTYLRNDTALCNAFIINKENSEFLQEVMKKIETIDEKIKNMSTSKKLINKSQMIIHHTGPGNINYSIEEIDDDFYFSSCNQPKIANLNTLNSIASSWFVPYLHKHAFKNPLELKSLFWANKDETKKYFNNLDLQLKKMQDLNIKEEPEEERE
ncbi:MAG: glycosyltransferase, partial [Spiroplasma sp.]